MLRWGKRDLAVAQGGVAWVALPKIRLPPVPQAWRSCARHHVPLLPFGPDGVGGL